MRLTLFLQVHAAFRDHDRYVAVYVALSMLVKQGYCDVRVGYALNEGYSEDTWKCNLYVSRYLSVNAHERRWWGDWRHCWRGTQPYQERLRS